MKGSDGMTTLKLELQSKDVSQLEQKLVTCHYHTRVAEVGVTTTNPEE